MRNSNLAEVETTITDTSYHIDQRSGEDKSGSSVSDNSKEFSFIGYRNENDETLVKLYLEHEDEWAFNEIVNRYSCKIYRQALRFTKNERNADDILQEVFLTLVEKLETFRYESKFSTWLFGITKNTSLMYLRKHKKYQSEVFLQDDTYSEEGAQYLIPVEDWRFIPDQILIQEKKRENIDKAMMEIPEIYRTVLRLKDMEGHSSKEVSKLLGLSVAAVKSRVLRARLQIKDKLSEYNPIELY